MSEEFDAYSDRYDRLLEEAVAITGFDAVHFVRQKLATLRRLFDELARRPIEFLDYGCGPGNLYPQLAEFFPQARYVGTDASAAMIERARARFPAADGFCPLDSEIWRRRSYDLIFSSGVFHHIDHAEHPRVLTLLAGRLKPGGRIAIWEHNPINPFTRKIVRDCAFDRDAVLISASRMRRQLRRAGLEPVRIVYVTFFPRALSYLLPLEPLLGWLPVGGQYVALASRREAGHDDRKRSERTRSSSPHLGEDRS